MTNTVKNPLPGRCIAEVAEPGRWINYYQCQNKRKHGDFCGTHSPEAQARRDAKSKVAHEAWKKRLDAPKLERERLETINAKLLAALEEAPLPTVAGTAFREWYYSKRSDAIKAAKETK